MSINNENLDSWFESLANEALERNVKSVCTWTKYKGDLEETKKILSWLPKKLKHDVMVPIGTKALMRGKMVHTNELLVNIGEAWFVKRTASQTLDMCDRRIKECDNMLERLEKEKELLESKKSLPAEKEAFGSVERPEIVEYVTEECHEEWKKQHRLKEREYRKKLAEMREKEKKTIETEEDLWNRLDELELREELEDELYRLNAENETDSAQENLSDNSDEGVEIFNKNECLSSIAVNDPEHAKKEVSFAVDVDECTVSDEPLRLEITHSANVPKMVPFTGEINSPEDIYQAYLKMHNPKPILKHYIDSNKEKELNHVSNEPDEENEMQISSGIMLPDVIARDVVEHGDSFGTQGKDISIKEDSRRISKFKASRMKKS